MGGENRAVEECQSGEQLSGRQTTPGQQVRAVPIRGFHFDELKRPSRNDPISPLRRR